MERHVPNTVPDASAARPPLAWAVPALIAGTLLWFVADFYFLGELGRWSDDWPFNLRDPDTGSYSLLPTQYLPHYFHRPLFHITVYTLHTLLANHLQVLHLLTALSHGLVTVLLFLLLRRLRVSPTSATLAALFFLGCPSAWDVPLWATTMSTSLATAAMLVGAHLFLHYVRGTSAAPLTLLAIALALFASCCWNEQPACAVAAFPMLALAVSPSFRLFPVRRMLIALVPAVAACALYLAFYYSTAGLASRGGPSRFIDAAALRSKLHWIPRQALHAMLLRQFGAGAFRQGVSELVALRPMNLVVMPLLIGGIGMFVWRLARPAADDPVPEAPPRTHRSLRVAAFGAALFLAPFLPFFLIRDEWISSRVTYAPALGLAVILAAFAELFLKRTATPPMRRVLRAPFAVASASALVAMTVVMVGAQSGFHNRERLDQLEASGLRAALPQPAQKSIFIPIQVSSRPTHTANRGFDETFQSPLCITWSARWFIRRAYGSRDLEATFCSPDSPGLRDASLQGLLWDQRVVQPIDRHFNEFPTDADGRTILPWERVIPFAIDPAGKVLLITQIEVHRQDQPPETFSVPQTAAAARVHTELARSAILTIRPREAPSIRLAAPPH